MDSLNNSHATRGDDEDTRKLLTMLSEGGPK